MTPELDIADLADRLRRSRSLAAKRAIAPVVERLALNGPKEIAVGDDCAAIPDGDGYLLLAIEGFLSEFVTGDPWFAGWCGIMVNLADVAAMGGRPVAVVDCVLASDGNVDAILSGMLSASSVFGVPVVGGHTATSGHDGQLAVAILGRANKLLSSFDARPGDRLVVAIDLRGRYREPYPNWEAATDAPAERLRACFDLLPQIAEAGLSRAAKDISQAGIVGTAIMLAECSKVAISIELDRLPKPAGVALDRWLQSFPSFGFIVAVRPENVPAVIARFEAMGVSAADVGGITAGSHVDISMGGARAVVWDLADEPLMGLGLSEEAVT